MRIRIPKRYAAKAAKLAIACVLLTGCNAFSLVGLLDTPPQNSDNSSGTSSTLRLIPDSANILVSQQRKFTATGGAGGYSYAVETGGAGGIINPGTGDYTAPASPGTDTILVMDSAGATYEATAMVTASIPLTITPVTITLSAGAQVAFTANGGTAPYTYSVTVGTGSINAGGLYTAPPNMEADNTVHVVDSAGPSNTADAIVKITDPPALQISPTTASLNANDTFTFTASGGVPPYNFTVTTGSGTINAATGFFTAPNTAVIETDTVKVIDAGGGTRISVATVTVYPVGSPLAISPSPTSAVDAGQTLAFTASGGTPPYTFSVAGIGGINSSTGLYTAPPSGGTAIVTVTDSVLAAKSSALTINPPALLQIAPTSLSLATGSTSTFSATGGIPPYSYSVVTGGAGGTVNSGSGLYTAPGVEGSDTVRVTDAASHTSSAPVTIYFPMTIVPTDAAVQQGDTYSFDASGGAAPYTYSVFSGPGSIDPDGTYHASGGAGTATVKVVDSLSNASTATVTVTAPTTWTIQGIDTAARSGQYASLALSGGVPQIAYYESKNKELRLEKWNGSSWTRQTVDTSGTVGQYASLALDAGGNARISYYDATNRRLRYAAWNGSSWAKQTVDSGGNLGKYTSIALDSTGKPRISYYDSNNSQLKYASWNGSSWTKQVVDSAGDVGMYSSLALDAGGNPRISYYDNTNHRLKYAWWNGSSWTTQVVDSGGDVGMYSSLALDPGGNPHISYYDAVGKQLEYVSAVVTAWGAPQVVDSGNVGMYTSLAIDAGGNPHVSYYDAGGRHLKYATAVGAVWGAPQTPDPSNNVGMYSSLKLDPAPPYKARIAYYNSSSQDLKFAKEQ